MYKLCGISQNNGVMVLEGLTPIDPARFSTFLATDENSSKFEFRVYAQGSNLQSWQAFFMTVAMPTMFRPLKYPVTRDVFKLQVDCAIH